MKGESEAIFQLGFQSGIWGRGDQVSNYVFFGPGKSYSIDKEWQEYSIPIKELDKGAVFEDITNLFYLRCDEGFDGKKIQIKNIYYSNN